MIEEPIWRPVGPSEMMVPERVTGRSPGWRVLVVEDGFCGVCGDEVARDGENGG